MFSKKITKEDKELLNYFRQIYINNYEIFMDCLKKYSKENSIKLITNLFQKNNFDKTNLLSEHNEINMDEYKVTRRAISADNNEILNKYIDDFTSGPIYMGGKASIYGFGMYTYYGNNQELLNSYSNNGNTQNCGVIFDLLVPEDFKMIEYEKLDDLYNYYKNLYTKFESKHDTNEYKNYVDNILGNMGIFATLLGYDGIDVKDKEYLVVLNKSKIIINDKILQNDISRKK